MNCLQDYISIQYPGAVTPDSGLYVNQLPGISLKGIDKIANEEQVTFAGVWADVQQRSLKKFITSITNYFAKKFQLRTVHEAVQLPNAYLHQTQNQTPAAAEYRGITWDLGWRASPLASIHIEELQIYLLATQSSVTFKVFEVIDINNVNELDTLTLTGGVVGWNTLKVNKDYKAWKVFICYDATTIDSIWMPLNRGYDMLENQQSLVNWVYYSPCQMWLYGANSSNPYANLVEGNNTYGLSGKISTVCTFDAIICGNKEKFATALWYALGAELMTERIFSDRLNRYTTIDLARAKELRDYFQQTSENELATTLDGIHNIPQDCCLDCNGQVKIMTSIP